MLKEYFCVLEIKVTNIYKMIIAVLRAVDNMMDNIDRNFVNASDLLIEIYNKLLRSGFSDTYTNIFTSWWRCACELSIASSMYGLSNLQTKRRNISIQVQVYNFMNYYLNI